MASNSNISGDVKRLWRWIQARAGDAARRNEAASDDPEVLLDRAQHEMQMMHAQNRERAVQAITHKNELERAVQNVRARVADLQSATDEAERSGDRVTAQKRRSDLHACEAELAHGEALLAQAVEAAQLVKEAIRQEEEILRRKMSEAIALKAQWRSAQMETALTRSQTALEALSRIEGENETDFREKLREALHTREMLRLSERDLTDKITSLREKANAARKQGDEDEERALLREMEQFEAALEVTQTALERANEVVGRMRTAQTGGDAEEYDTFPAGAGGLSAVAPNEKMWLGVALAFAFAALLIILALL